MWGVEFLGDLYECTWSWRKKIVWILVGMVEQCEKVLGCKFTTVGVIMQKGILNKWIFMWGLSFWVICANFSWNGLIVWKIFRLQIHNCWCHYAKSYTKKIQIFYIGAWFYGWFVWMHLFLEEIIGVDLVEMV